MNIDSRNAISFKSFAFASSVIITDEAKAKRLNEIVFLESIYI